MKICLVGLDNLPVLAPEYRQHTVAGEPVQQTLLARALARRGHEASMVVRDFGQADGAQWEGIRVWKAYLREAGVPVLRFAHPRWSGLWSALGRADADIYYTSCAGMEAGLVALFCRWHGRRFVFRTASDPDCDKARVHLLVRYARDRWLYEYGLRHADAILVQSAEQAQALAASFGLEGRVAPMLVDEPLPACARDIDVLWVSNIRSEKRPDRFVELAQRLPQVKMHMVGGPLPGAEAMFDEIRRAVAAQPNVVFHGFLSYPATNDLYGRARLLVNTSDIEGFPNSYLQAWVRGVPVVTLIDPDRVIAREGLGAAVASPGEVPTAVMALLGDPAAWHAASERCRAFMAREYGEEKVIAAYLETFESVMRSGTGRPEMIVSGNAPHA